jgi:hypothetical protein
MFDFDFFKHKDAEPAAKLTIHKNSKAGFSAAADELMGLSDWKWCAFAKDKNENDDRLIYMIKMDSPSEITFNISKAGDYYYIKAKSLLDDLDIDYADESTRTIFDITPIENNGQTVYRLTKRVIKKRNKKAE